MKNYHALINGRFFGVSLLFLSLLMVSQNIVFASDSLSIASPFTDHAVLQRDKNIAVWGTAAPNLSVTISINNTVAKATADREGNWKAMLAPMPAGGPYTLQVTAGADSLEVKDVLIGDVWLCSGQSNMQMTLKEVVNASDEIATAVSHPQLRFLTVNKTASDKRESRFDGDWQICTTETAADFSAVAYHFAHELYESSELKGVPIGLIDSSFGGTVIEGWIPASKLSSFPEEEMRGSMFGIPSSSLYNAMIAPLTPYTLKGSVWYQGEGNASHPQPYAQLLTMLIEQWRKEFESKDLPFFVVELPPSDGDWGGYYFVWLREMQRQVAMKVPHVELATTLNTHDGSDLHPKEKHEIGTRLALLARHEVYGEDVVVKGPVYKSAVPDGSKMRVTFETAGSAIASRSEGKLRGFVVAGSDGQYRFADAEIDGTDTVIVQSDLVQEPKYVRYAWDPIPEADLYNVAGLPAAPFRTDNAPVEPLIKLLMQPQSRRVKGTNYEVDISGFGKIINLNVHGQQFISNAPGAFGGSSIPVMFGEKELRNVQNIGPNSVCFSDHEFAFSLSFESDEMFWQMENRGDENKNFRLALAPQVEVKGLGGTNFELRRGEAAFKLKGMTIVNETVEQGVLLEVEVPAKGSATLEFEVQ